MSDLNAVNLERITEGEIIYCPGGIPHSPRFAPEAFVLFHERKRRADERDKVTWFCESCDQVLYESTRHVSDYDTDPVSRAYEETYGSEKSRTCASCGNVTPRPVVATIPAA